MKTKKSENITVGNISNATGVAIGHGTQAIVTNAHDMQSDEISHSFHILFQKMKALPDGATKSDAIDAVKGLEEEARKGDQADENRVRRWFNFLAETAPDIWQVAIDTFINPIKGISTVFSKVAERARLEKLSKNSK